MHMQALKKKHTAGEIDSGISLPEIKKLCKTGKMIWTREQLEHNWLIPKDIWHIFYLKGLVDFIHLQWQI